MFKIEQVTQSKARKGSEFDTVSTPMNPPKMFKVKKQLISSDLKKKFASHRKKMEERKSTLEDESLVPP